MKTLIHKLLRALGYHLVNAQGFHRMEDMLIHARCLSPDVSTVIDIGASDGRWSAQCMEQYDRANFLLLEANPVHKEKLDGFCERFPKARYEIAVAGRCMGEVVFDLSDPFGGVASFSPASSGVRLAMTTIDNEIGTRGLAGPFLLKFDTHGFEVPIIEGAQETLRNTNVIIMEVYNFKISDECLKFWEMCAYLDRLGFSPVDMAEPLYRKKDSVWWQMDIMFVRKDCIALKSNSYMG